MTIRSPIAANFSVADSAQSWRDPLTGSQLNLKKRINIPMFNPVNGSIQSGAISALTMELNSNVCLSNGSRQLVSRIIVKSFVPRLNLVAGRATIINEPNVAPNGAIVWTAQDYLDTLSYVPVLLASKGVTYVF